MPWNVLNSNWVSKLHLFRYDVCRIRFFFHLNHSLICSFSSWSQWNWCWYRNFVLSGVCTSDFWWKWMHFWLQRPENSFVLYSWTTEYLHGFEVHVTYRRYSKWWSKEWRCYWSHLKTLDHRLLLHKHRRIPIEIGQRRIICAVWWENLQLGHWRGKQHTSYNRNLREQHTNTWFSLVSCTITNIFAMVCRCRQLYWHHRSTMDVFRCVSIQFFCFIHYQKKKGQLIW